MKFLIGNTARPALGLMVALLAACGGGGGSDSSSANSTGTSATAAAPGSAPASAPAPASTAASAPASAPTAAPTGTSANLNDPVNAIRLAAAMTQTTWVAGTLTPTKWSGALYKVPTRTDVGTCGNSIYSNVDGVPGVGDKFEANAVNCVTSNSVGSLTLNRHIVTSLTTISNSQLPVSSAWNVSESIAISGTTVWDIAVTSSIRSKGDSTTIGSAVQTVSHTSDGGQQDGLQSYHTSAKGTHDGFAFDYVIDTSYVCTFPAATKKAIGDTCANSVATLKGSFNGGAANATLTQTTTGAATFDIAQAGQTVRVAKNLQSGEYTVTTANGQQIVIAAGNFESIARY